MKAGKITAELARDTDFRFPRGRYWYRWVAKVSGLVLLVHETANKRRLISVDVQRRLVAQRRLNFPGTQP